MKILPINVQSSNSKHTKLSSDNNLAQAFKARLLVQSSANNVGLKKFGECRWIWNEIIESFKQKLRNDPIKPHDLVVLRALPWEKAKSVYTGEVEEYEQQYYIHDGHGSGQHIKYKAKRPRYRYEDLEVSINNSKEGFMLNTNNSAEEIAEDLYNTYKRVRYKEHFDN